MFSYAIYAKTFDYFCASFTQTDTNKDKKDIIIKLNGKKSSKKINTQSARKKIG